MNQGAVRQEGKRVSKQETTERVLIWKWPYWCGQMSYVIERTNDIAWQLERIPSLNMRGSVALAAMESLQAVSLLYGSNGQSWQGGVNVRSIFKIFSIERRHYSFQTQRCHKKVVGNISRSMWCDDWQIFQRCLVKVIKILHFSEQQKHLHFGSN